MEQQGTRTQRFGWYMVDWANSAFVTTVVTVFLGPYLTTVAKASADSSGNIPLFGLAIQAGSLFPLAVSASVILQVLVLPLLGTLTDRTAHKSSMLVLTSFIGAGATTALYTLSAESHNHLLGAALFIIANVTFGASVVIANAFLPILAKPDERDALSSRGWALGYLGGGLLLLVQLLWFKSAEESGAAALAVRGILASAGVWWAVFIVVPWMTLPRITPVQAPSQESPFSQFVVTLRDMRKVPMTLLFFVAYLLYNETIQTVIQMSSAYGQAELGLDLSTLTQAILLVQFVAIGGSLLFERIARVIGAKYAIVVGLAGWAVVLVAAYAWVTSATGFYVLAAVIAVVLGGTQALSRSLFSVMIPPGKAAEYFALYEISDKGTSWLGPLAFAVALNLTHSYRVAILSLIIFLIVGLLLLLRVNVQRARAESGNVS
jgi:UMF1 family MFS transporter